jgi:hypothetical protein
VCSLCQSFREQKFTRNFPAISSNYTDSSHPSFSMKLIHRARFKYALMTSPLHHSAGWHCIIRLQRQLYLIARTTDETFCLAAKTLQKLQILSSLSLFRALYRSVSRIAKKLPAIAILAKLLCMLTQLSKWRSMQMLCLVPWKLFHGIC